MQRNEIVKINGLKGEWRVLDSQFIPDKNKEVDMIYVIESTSFGEAATTFINKDKKFISQFDCLEDFDEIERYMEDYSWREII